MSYSYLIHHDAQQLIRRMRELQEEPDREMAHKEADQILRIAVHKAATGEFDEVQAVALISAWDAVERWYG